MHAGAYWADLGLNYCAKCDLKDTGASGLLWGTVPNVLIGLTPWVDNFMHLGGFITGAAVTVLLLPELRVSATVVNPYDPSGVCAGVKASPGPLTTSPPPSLQPTASSAPPHRLCPRRSSRRPWAGSESRRCACDCF